MSTLIPPELAHAVVREALIADFSTSLIGGVTDRAAAERKADKLIESGQAMAYLEATAEPCLPRRSA